MNFIVFRYFLNPFQGSLFGHLADQRAKTFLESILTNTEIATQRGRVYGIRVAQQEPPTIYGKLARKVTDQIFRKDPTDFTDVEVESWPNIHFVADTDRQILVLEHRTSFQGNYSYLARSLSEAATAKTIGHGFAVNFALVIENSAFWDSVRSAKSLYSVKFKMRSPNLFGAANKANEALKEIQNIFNNTETEIKLNNEDGKLTIPEDRAETYREYCDEGGGEWTVIKLNASGKKVIVKSSNSLVKFDLEISLDFDAHIANIIEKAKSLLKL